MANNTNSNPMSSDVRCAGSWNLIAPMASIGRPGLHTSLTVAEDRIALRKSLARVRQLARMCLNGGEANTCSGRETLWLNVSHTNTRSANTCSVTQFTLSPLVSDTCTLYPSVWDNTPT